MRPYLFFPSYPNLWCPLKEHQQSGNDPNKFTIVIHIRASDKLSVIQKKRGHGCEDSEVESDGKVCQCPEIFFEF